VRPVINALGHIKIINSSAQRPGTFITPYLSSPRRVWPHSQRLADEAPGHSRSGE